MTVFPEDVGLPEDVGFPEDVGLPDDVVPKVQTEGVVGQNCVWQVVVASETVTQL